MFKEIFFFELKYRRSRPATYIYFAIIFVVCFLTAANPKKFEVGQIHINAPYVISMMMLTISFALSMITSAIMGVSIIRDFDYNIESVLFSTPLKKADYLLGRFAGSMIVLILISCGTFLGFMSGFLLGKVLPWEVAWANQELLPLNLWHYFQPFLVFFVTNLFIT